MTAILFAGGLLVAFYGAMSNNLAACAAGFIVITAAVAWEKI